MLVFKVYDYFHDAKVWCVFDRLCQSVKKSCKIFTLFFGATSPFAYKFVPLRL